MGHDPTEENDGLASIERYRSAGHYSCGADCRQRFANKFRIDYQLACRAIHSAICERGDDGNVAIHDVAIGPRESLRSARNRCKSHRRSRKR